MLMISNWTPEDTPTSDSPPRRARRISWGAWAVLAIALVVGGYFRTLNLFGWDGDSYLHPDERFIVFTVTNLSVPHSFADYLRSSCVGDGSFASPRAANEQGQP